MKLYLLGLLLTGLPLTLQIAAAIEVKECSRTLPFIWISTSLGALMFAIDSWNKSYWYSLYFSWVFIIMLIASVIVWKKAK